MHVRVLRDERPVEPARLVVLAVGIVVAPLRAAHLVAHQNHGHADRQQRDGQKVLHLPVAKRLDARIVRRTFDPTVPAPVVVGAVTVVFAIGLVVLAVVGDEVVEGEAIVTRHEVDALLRLALLVCVDVGAADQAVGHARHRARLAAEKTPDIVAKPPVPLLPAVAHERADLVQAGGIPRLGDELRAREQRVRLDIPQHGRTRQRIARGVAREHRCEVEPKAIHVHRLDPVAETVHDHPPDDRLVGVERVPRARVVGVAGAVVLEDVVGHVVEPAKAQRRPVVVALGGVVEDDVENDLDARSMQRLDHVAEFVDRPQGILPRAVRLMRREERDRRVAPVIDESRRRVLGVELKHRQELDGGDPEVAEIRNLLDEPGKRAARLLGHAGARMAGEPSDVHLVHDRVRGGPSQRRVALPVVRAAIHHHALHHRAGVVAVFPCRLATVPRRHDHAAPIGIEKDLARIESHPGSRIERPLHTISVQLSRTHAGHERVPVEVRAVGRGVELDHVRGPWVIDTFEEQERDPGGVSREQAEVDAVVRTRRAQR